MGGAKKIKQQDQSLESKLQEVGLYAGACRKRARKLCPNYFKDNTFLPRSPKNLLKDGAAHLFNVFYAPVYVIALDTVFWLEEMGWSGPRELFNYFPLHLKTHFQKQSEDFLRQKIFQLDQGIDPQYEQFLQKTLRRFNSRQNEKSDLNISLVSLAIGYLFFKNHSFSLTEVTKSIATYWANEEASSQFFLGKSIGGAFYSIFPEEPSGWHLVLTGIVVLLGFGLMNYVLSNLLIFLQLRFGLYERRVQMIIDRMESEIFLHLNDLTPTVRWDREAIRSTFQQPQ